MYEKIMDIFTSLLFKGFWKTYKKNQYESTHELWHIKYDQLSKKGEGNYCEKLNEQPGDRWCVGHLVDESGIMNVCQWVFSMNILLLLTEDYRSILRIYLPFLCTLRSIITFILRLSIKSEAYFDFCFSMSVHYIGKNILLFIKIPPVICI